MFYLDFQIVLAYKGILMCIENGTRGRENAKKYLQFFFVFLNKLKIN